MRDKTKENVLKALRNNSKLNEDETKWVSSKLKEYDKLADQQVKLERSYTLFKQKLAKLEVTHVADNSEYSKGYLAALKEFQKMLEGENLL